MIHADPPADVLVLLVIRMISGISALRAAISAASDGGTGGGWMADNSSTDRAAMFTMHLLARDGQEEE